MSYSLKSFPVSIKQTIEDIFCIEICGNQSEAAILATHRFVTLSLVEGPGARLSLVEKCLLSGTWKQAVGYTGASLTWLNILIKIQ